jgi:hypothetical protein
MLEAEGDREGARQHYERALGIFRMRLPEGHEYIRIVEGNLEGLEREMGDGEV